MLSGINTGVLVGNNVTVKNETGKYNVGETTDINKLIYSGMLGFNLEYELFKKHLIFN